ncbi:ABC transporter permease [Nonomuraea sp. NPDC049421]|uniref:ABC transporter permease n=1 Tax=Nonomuraea sp. NPDC049421 TaxID=3155275 RepID=UPI0034397847
MTRRFLSDTTVMLGRSLRHISRSPDTVITTTIMPIGMMLLFVYVFGGAIDTGQVAYVGYLLPGILLITVASGIAYTAFRLFLDMQSGIFERFQSMPLARSSVLWAHVLTSLVANLISLALTWLAVIPGLTAKSADGAGAFSYPLIFLPFISSAFVPTATMPGPLRAFAEHQPVTAIVNAIRGLFAGHPAAADVWTAVAWCAGLLVVVYVLAMATYRRKIT